MNIKKTKTPVLFVNFPLEPIHDIHREPFWRPLVQIICLGTVGKSQAHVFRCLPKDLEHIIKKSKAEGINLHYLKPRIKQIKYSEGRNFA